MGLSPEPVADSMWTGSELRPPSWYVEPSTILSARREGHIESREPTGVWFLHRVLKGLQPGSLGEMHTYGRKSHHGQGMEATQMSIPDGMGTQTVLWPHNRILPIL